IGQNGLETVAPGGRETGGWLMMTGGRASYRAGGYYKSPPGPITPGSMGLCHKHRKPSLPNVGEQGRSGREAMTRARGKQKMDLANLGTAAVRDLLGPGDEFGCIAVDTEPHTIADLAPVTNKEKVRKDILGIQSMGGGIFIDVALQAAGKMILPAKS